MENERVNLKEALICKFIERKTKVAILTKNNGFYRGYILAFGDHAILLKDKFDKEVVLDLDFISKIEEAKN